MSWARRPISSVMRGGDNFIVITREQKAEALKDRLKERFDQEVQTPL